MPGYPRLGLVLLVAICLRLLNLWLTPLDPALIINADANTYWQGAGDMLREMRFVRVTDQVVAPETERVPLYYIWLAAFRAVFGEALVPVLVGQAILDALTCALIALIAAHVAPTLLLPVGLLAAAWPNLIIQSAQLLTDSLFLHFCCLGLLAFMRLWDRGGLPMAAALGCAIGVGTLSRTVAQFLLPFLPFLAGAAVWRVRRSGQAALAAVLITAIAAALPIAPLVWRNVTQFGSTALTSQGGGHLLGWVAPAVLQAAAPGRSRAEAQMALKSATPPAADASGGRPNPFGESEILSRRAGAAILAAGPAAIATAWMQGMTINIVAPALLVDPRVMALPHPSFMEATQGGLLTRLTDFVRIASPSYTLALGLGLVGSVVACLLQLYGLWIFARRHLLLALFSAGWVAYFLLVNGPVASPKYRLPMEPCLLLWTGMALLDIWNRIKRPKA